MFLQNGLVNRIIESRVIKTDRRYYSWLNRIGIFDINPLKGLSGNEQPGAYA